MTSTAAFGGIAIALWGGPGWETADDWAALVAAGVIAYNGIAILRSAIRDLMDATPDESILAGIRDVATQVTGVVAIEKLLVRRSEMKFDVAIHVQAAPTMPLSDAHSLGGRVKAAIRQANLRVGHVLVHMEPFSDTTSPEPRLRPKK